MEDKKKSEFPIIDGRETKKFSYEKFDLFLPVRDSKDLSKGYSNYPHLRVDKDGKSHFSDLIVHKEDPNKFGEGSLRMIQTMKSVDTGKNSVVDSRVRVSIKGEQLMHRTKEEALSDPGTISPRTQNNNKPRY